MDQPPNKRSGLGNIFGSSSDPDLNIPYNRPSAGIQSPYLNYDPAYITPDTDQFIFLEGAESHRGRFEKAFSQIGGSVIVGAGVGGINGIWSGFKETKELTGAVRKTQMLNFITKQGAASAQTLGVIALIYSIFGVVISKARGNVEDDINTISAGTLTGVVLKSRGGLKAIAKGGGVGLGIASAYVALKYLDFNRLKFWNRR